MIQEIKISLPVYKIIYALSFIVILSLVRGVTYSYETGIVLEAPMAVLAFSLCADTYTREIISKRSEIQRLYLLKKRIYSLYRRIAVQEIFLLMLAVIGYGLFFVFQKPGRFAMGQNGVENEMHQFLIYFAAVAVTLICWGLLSNLLACLFRNTWAGIGGCLILWLLTNSSVGDRYLGVWNLFSYTFRDVENSSDFSWVWGKIVCMGIGAAAAAILPKVIEKRG